MTIASDLTSARAALRKLRPTQSVVIEHVCHEDRVVLQCEGFSVQPAPLLNGWIVRPS